MNPATIGGALRKPISVQRWLVGVLAIAGLIGALHGRSVSHGLFMDDYAHVRQLRECDWSIGGLASACRLELVGGVIDLWWMPEVTLRFFRPVSFGLMKLTYTLSGWSAAAAHVASLGWHLLVCVLLLVLLRRLGATFGLAWAVAALFALHPAHVATVQWIACQSELMVTAFMLGATLCFAHCRAWPAAAAAPALASPRGRAIIAGGAAIVLFALALGCRENAIVFPLVMLSAEAFAPRGRRRAAVPLYLGLFAVAGVYLLVRGYYLGGAALPPPPYVYPPGRPGFAQYVVDKACYYLLGEFLLVPCVPLAGLTYLRSHALGFYLGAAAILAVLVALHASRWRCAPGWLGPVWLAAFVGPVLPAFESPHHLYLPGIGWALCAWVLFQALCGARPRAGAPLWARLRYAGGGSAILLTGLVFGTTTHFFGLALATGQAVEDRVAAEIASAPRPVRDGDTVYVANLPLLAHYTQLALEENYGIKTRVIGLTWSPRIMGLVGGMTPSELITIDTQTVELAIAEDRYFAGPLGFLAAEASGRPTPIRPGESLTHGGLTITGESADAAGTSRLRFRFATPPGRPGVHLFWGSRVRWAYQVTAPESPP